MHLEIKLYFCQSKQTDNDWLQWMTSLSAWARSEHRATNWCRFHASPTLQKQNISMQSRFGGKGKNRMQYGNLRGKIRLLRGLRRELAKF